MGKRRAAFFVAAFMSLFLGMGITLPALARSSGERANRDDGRRPAASGASVTRTWAGQLCDGTAVTITYAVGAGSVSVSSVSGAPNQVSNSRRGAEVVFDHGARVAFSTVSGHDGRGEGEGEADGGRGDRKAGTRLAVRADLGECPTPAAPVVTPPPTAAPTSTTSTTAHSGTTLVTTATSTPASTTPPTAPPTQPPTSVPPTTVPATTVPPTTTRQTKYLTWTTPAGTFTAQLDVNNQLSYWAINTPGWAWFTSVRGPGSTVTVEISNSAGDQGAFTVKMTNGSPVATFTSSSGGTVTPAAPSQSTVAPAKTAPSGQ